MFDLLWVILFVVLFIRISSLSGRISTLEWKLGKKETAPAAQNAPVVGQNPVVQAAPAAEQVVTPTASPFIEWLKENWLSKLGVLLILIGFGWFISYAFVHNWIGPVGRVALGFVVGAVLCALGALRMSKDSVQANVLLVLGSVMVMMTGYASRVVYDFFSPGAILLLSAMVASYITTLALTYDREKLAVYGVVVAMAAPLFTHAVTPSVIGLFLYLAVVSVASVWVSVWRKWGTVNVAALFGVLVYAAPFVFGLESLSEPEKVTVVFITSMLSLLYFVVNVLGIVKTGEAVEKHAVYVAIANSLLIFSVVTALVVEEFQSLLFAGWMIIFAAGSLYVSAHIKRQTFFYIYAMVSVLFLGVVTAIELSGPVLTIAFMLEAAIITLLTFVMTKKLVNSAYMSLLMIVPALLSLESFDQSAWGLSIFHKDSAVIILMTILFLVLGFFLMKRYKQGIHDEAVHTFYVILNCVGAVYGFAFIWLGTHALWYTDLATILSLALYTVVGIVAYIQGALVEQNSLKKFGAGVLLLVIIRLVLIDVWQMPLAPRIITFMLIGVLLVSTAFIGRKKKEHAIEVPATPVVPSSTPASVNTDTAEAASERYPDLFPKQTNHEETQG